MTSKCGTSGNQCGVTSNIFDISEFISLRVFTFYSFELSTFSLSDSSFPPFAFQECFDAKLTVICRLVINN